MNYNEYQMHTSTLLSDLHKTLFLLSLSTFRQVSSVNKEYYFKTNAINNPASIRERKPCKANNCISF